MAFVKFVLFILLIGVMVLNTKSNDSIFSTELKFKELAGEWNVYAYNLVSSQYKLPNLTQWKFHITIPKQKKICKLQGKSSFYDMDTKKKIDSGFMLKKGRSSSGVLANLDITSPKIEEPVNISFAKSSDCYVHVRLRSSKSTIDMYLYNAKQRYNTTINTYLKSQKDITFVNQVVESAEISSIENSTPNANSSDGDNNKGHDGNTEGGDDYYDDYDGEETTTKSPDHAPSMQISIFLYSYSIISILCNIFPISLGAH